jgi:hypothetical protein
MFIAMGAFILTFTIMSLLGVLMCVMIPLLLTVSALVIVFICVLIVTFLVVEKQTLVSLLDALGKFVWPFVHENECNVQQFLRLIVHHYSQHQERDNLNHEFEHAPLVVYRAPLKYLSSFPVLNLPQDLTHRTEENEEESRE